MLSKSIVLVIGFLLLGTAVSTQTWSSWWGETTRYDGARTLKNRSYKSLEIHGAATLDHVTVEKNLMVTGSTELEDSTVQGNVTIMGALETKGACVLGGRADIKGGLIAQGLQAKGKLVVGGSIESTDSQFGFIVAKSNKNETYMFTKSDGDALTVYGLGTKRVTLKDAHFSTIEFGDSEGVVVLKGSATVGGVINGKIEKK